MAIEGIEETKQEDKQVLEMKSLNFNTTPENKKFNHVTCMTSYVDTVEFI